MYTTYIGMACRGWSRGREVGGLRERRIRGCIYIVNIYIESMYTYCIIVYGMLFKCISFMVWLYCIKICTICICEAYI